VTERPDPIAGALRLGLRRLVRGGLRGIWVRGDNPSGPSVYAANHHSWWDPFVANAVLESRGLAPALLMQHENLSTFGFARRLDVFGSQDLRRGVELLRAGRVVVVFPEGELRPPAGLGALARGAAWYAQRAPAPLYSAATRVLLRGHQAAEAYVSVRTVDASGALAAATAALAESLAADLTDIDAIAGRSEPRQPLPGFRPVMVGKHSWDERIVAVTRRPR
jgi:hypothetical protein